KKSLRVNHRKGLGNRFGNFVHLQSIDNEYYMLHKVYIAKESRNLRPYPVTNSRVVSSQLNIL
ncbi:hypothetical protein SERLA73DRAFT_139445, partial [Serpula lacrymans var. lacrymans S7.3]